MLPLTLQQVQLVVAQDTLGQPLVDQPRHQGHNGRAVGPAPRRRAPVPPRRIDLMKRTRWPALLVLLLPGTASAQFLLPLPAGGLDFGFTRVRKHSAVSFSLSRGYGGFHGFVYGNPY